MVIVVPFFGLMIDLPADIELICPGLSDFFSLLMFLNFM